MPRPQFSLRFTLALGLLVPGLLTLPAHAVEWDQPAVVASKDAAPAVRLRPKWVAGETATYDMRLETRMAASVLTNEGGRQTQLYRQEARFSRRVVKTSPEATILLVTIERLRMQVSAGGQVVWHDSASKEFNNEAPELKQAIDSAVGRPVTITLNAAGEITSIEGNQDPEPTNEQEAKRPRIPQSILGDKVIRSVWRPLFGIPGAPETAAPGHSWTLEEQTSESAMGIFHTKITSTLAPATGATASVAITGTARLTPAMGPSAIKGELKESSITGTYEWDAASATLRSMVGRQFQSVEGERGELKQRVDTTTLRQFTRVNTSTSEADWGSTNPPRGPEVPEPAKAETK